MQVTSTIGFKKEVCIFLMSGRRIIQQSYPVMIRERKHLMEAGHYVYTGLSFFRELPAGVPGAYRLFANMIALGKNKTND